MRLILLCALILVGLGTTLYQVKTGIDERQDRLHDLELRIVDAKRDIAVLEAEWAYLSRSERIMTLSGDLLKMTPIGQDRILPLDAIPMRLELDPVSIKEIAFTAKRSVSKDRSDSANQPASKDHSIRKDISE